MHILNITLKTTWKVKVMCAMGFMQLIQTISNFFTTEIQFPKKRFWSIPRKTSLVFFSLVEANRGLTGFYFWHRLQRSCEGYLVLMDGYFAEFIVLHTTQDFAFSQLAGTSGYSLLALVILINAPYWVLKKQNIKLKVFVGNCKKAAG